MTKDNISFLTAFLLLTEFFFGRTIMDSLVAVLTSKQRNATEAICSYRSIRTWLSLEFGIAVGKKWQLNDNRIQWDKHLKLAGIRRKKWRKLFQKFHH